MKNNRLTRIVRFMDFEKEVESGVTKIRDTDEGDFWVERQYFEGG